MERKTESITTNQANKLPGDQSDEQCRGVLRNGKL